MSAETAFYIIGIALAVTALAVSFIGLRFQNFPPNRAALLGGVAVFVILVGGATTFAWVNAEDEQEIRDEEIAAGELPGVDVAFIEESIVDPEAQPTKGFPAGVMPGNFGEVLSPEELDALVQFIAESVGA